MTDTEVYSLERNEKEVSIEAMRPVLVTNKVLKSLETLEINYDPDNFRNQPKEYMAEIIGESLPMVAVFILSADVDSEKNREDPFFIVDSRESMRYATPFIVLREELDPRTGIKYPTVKGIHPGTDNILGRSPDADNRFNHNSTVSSKHASIRFEDDKLTLTDLNSRNGTAIVAAIVMHDEDFTGVGHSVEANYTKHLNEELEIVEGMYKGHHVITRESQTVRLGVFGSRKPHSELILVDNDDPAVDEVVAQYISELDRARVDEKNILKIASETTNRTLRYDLDETERLSAQHYMSGELVGLSEYIKHGVGVCRHQALLDALLIERAVEEGFIDGKVRVERNIDRMHNSGHAWAVFSPRESAEDIIVDSTNGFVGTRAGARMQNLWRYYVDDRTREMGMIALDDIKTK